jgi:hypothetical protein
MISSLEILLLFLRELIKLDRRKLSILRMRRVVLVVKKEILGM